LRVDYFLLLRACSCESGACLCVIVFHTSDNASYEQTVELNDVIVEGVSPSAIKASFAAAASRSASAHVSQTSAMLGSAAGSLTRTESINRRIGSVLAFHSNSTAARSFLVSRSLGLITKTRSNTDSASA